MEPKQPELTFDESVKQVMQTLPPFIRTYLTQGKYTEVAQSLITKYGLRIDQGGILEREIMLLLMGIDNPSEFTQALIEEAKLDQKTVESIVQDVNLQVFVPLRAEERKGSAPPAPPKPVVVPPIKMTEPVNPPPSGSYAPPLQSPKYINTENTMPMRQNLGGAKAPVPPTPQRSSINQITKSPAPRSDLHDVLAKVMTPPKLLEDHEEPSIEFKPTTLRPPVNLPGALPPQVVPPAQSAPVAPYSSDPYREPIE